MVCDRASNATIYMALGTLYPTFSILFFACFVLDFGSHWLQFQSSACMKSTSHKGKNKKENWLVGLYYNNDTVFKITVPGAETAAVLLFIQAHLPALQSNYFWLFLVTVLSVILTFKMIVNVF